MNKIKSVEIINFRKIYHQLYTFNGENKVLTGENEAGKTTTLEAIMWVLSGQLLDGTASESKMNLTPIGMPLDTKTSVEITFENGESINKSYFRAITKNDDGEEIAGQGKVQYSINGGKPLSKNSEGIMFIENQLGIEHLSDKFARNNGLKTINIPALLLSTNHILTLDNKTLRELIIDIVGDVKVEDILAKYGVEKNYNILKDDLEKVSYDVNKLRDNIRFQIKGDKNTDGLEIKERILKSTIEKLTTEANTHVDPIELKQAKEKIELLNNEINNISSSLLLNEKETLNETGIKIAELKLKKQELESRLREEHRLNLEKQSKNPHEQKLNDLKTLYAKLMSNKNDILKGIEDLNGKIKLEQNYITFEENKKKSLYSKIEDLKNEYNEIKNRKVDNSEKITCPHCQQPFSTHETKEHLELEEERKNKEITKIVDTLKNLQLEKETIEVALAEREHNIKVLNGKLTTLTNELTQNDKSINETDSDLLSTKKLYDEAVIPVVDLNLNTPEMLDIIQEINKLELSKENSTEFLKIARQEKENQILELKEQVKVYQEVVIKDEVRKQTLLNIEKEKDNYLKLLGQLQEEQLKYELSKNVLIDVFKELEKRVVNVFGEDIYFKLYEPNVDGTIKTNICEIYLRDGLGTLTPIVNGISTGAYALQLVNFIERLKEHYNVKDSIILLDRLESLDNFKIDKLKQSKNQLITARVVNNQPKVALTDL